MQSSHLKDFSQGRPLKRTDTFNYDSELTISVGGTSAENLGHLVRYSANSLWLAIARPLKRVAAGTEYLFMDIVFSNLVLAAYFVYSVAVPRRREASLSMTRSRHAGSLSLKKLMDMLGAAAGLVLLSPLFLLIAILVKLDSPGPVFYTQLRVGRNRRRRDRRAADCLNAANRRGRDRRQENLLGRPFQVIKFRTMIDNAEKKCGPVWATKNDPRITRVGAFLRKTRFDELPQLFNVLKGEMSLIGPRPERPVFVQALAQEIDGYVGRLEFKPGITGLAQVENGYDTSVESAKAKVKYDLSYIHKWSLWQDLKILAKTVLVVVTGKGAF